MIPNLDFRLKLVSYIILSVYHTVLFVSTYPCFELHNISNRETTQRKLVL